MSLHIISYSNYKESLVGSLRSYRLYDYLIKKDRDVRFYTRNSFFDFETEVKELKIPSLIRKALNFIFLDVSFLWVIKVFKEIRRKDQDGIVYISCPPHGLLFLSFLINKTSKVKLITDFRDPFTLNDYYVKKGIRLKLNSWVEKRVLENSSHVVFNTNGHRKLYLEKFPNVNMNSTVINNGYIEENFENEKPNEIIYFGGHYKGEACKGLIEFAKKEQLKSKIVVYGEFHQLYLDNDDLFSYKGLIGRDELWVEASKYKYGICYLSLKFSKGASIATKLFEMLGMGICPICINPNNETKDVIKNVGFGICYRPEGNDNLWDEKNLILDSETKESIRVYKRENQYKKFDNIIDEIRKR